MVSNRILCVDCWPNILYVNSLIYLPNGYLAQSRYDGGLRVSIPDFRISRPQRPPNFHNLGKWVAGHLSRAEVCLSCLTERFLPLLCKVQPDSLFISHIGFLRL